MSFHPWGQGSAEPSNEGARQPTCTLALPRSTTHAVPINHAPGHLGTGSEGRRRAKVPSPSVHGCCQRCRRWPLQPPISSTLAARGAPHGVIAPLYRQYTAFNAACKSPLESGPPSTASLSRAGSAAQIWISRHAVAWNSGGGLEKPSGESPARPPAFWRVGHQQQVPGSAAAASEARRRP